jgi:hypothetical protein
MRSLPFVLLAFGTLFLSGCVTTAKEQYVKDGYRLLSGPEISVLVSGNTVEGRYWNGSGDFVDYFSPDGRVASIEPSGKHYLGSWKVDGDLLCFAYPEAALPYPKCVEIAEKGGHYVDFRTGGPTYGKVGAERTSFVPGNVKNLPLE